uniref:YchJ-like middle NTF2-like domain-containing protein n=2 Tax=Eutreptiella gymnastica TaxID=73025 RepID=A0A7S1N8V5_9EUGL|mmetsp:Transcript_135424/g.234892  ORF Transcript_135424/g.234892 Transcript_135424/m.234892 type:complete len:287 (+) Transcript_135424:466-1326(+)
MAAGFGLPPVDNSMLPQRKRLKLPKDPGLRVCKCGSKKVYKDCCALHHSGRSYPTTPDAVLRTRYTALLWNAKEFLYDSTIPEGVTPELKQRTTRSLKENAFVEMKILRVPDDKENKEEMEKLAEVRRAARMKRKAGLSSKLEVAGLARPSAAVEEKPAPVPEQDVEDDLDDEIPEELTLSMRTWYFKKNDPDRVVYTITEKCLMRRVDDRWLLAEVLETDNNTFRQGDAAKKNDDRIIKLRNQMSTMKKGMVVTYAKSLVKYNINNTKNQSPNAWHMPFKCADKK